jgi:hypothetical protein
MYSLFHKTVLREVTEYKSTKDLIDNIINSMEQSPS